MDDITTKTYNDLGVEYLKKIADATPPEIDEFIARVPKGGAVLDVGCAGGRESTIFVKNGFAVTGIDVAEILLSEAQRLVPEARFFLMDTRHLAFPESQFDGVWANAVLLHLQREEVPVALREFHRVLKPCGILHVRVKEGEGSRYDTNIVTGEKQRFFTYFGKEEITNTLKDAGFIIHISKRVPDDLGRSEVWIRILAESK